MKRYRQVSIENKNQVSQKKEEQDKTKILPHQVSILGLYELHVIHVQQNAIPQLSYGTNDSIPLQI